MTSSQTIVLITGESNPYLNANSNHDHLNANIPPAGANQGIGFETAKNLLFSSAAYHILLGSRDASKGSDAVSTLKSLAIKGTVTSVQIDVVDDASVDAAAKHVEDTYGRLDVLVNNAGIFSRNPSARDALREILAVNTIGAVSVTEAFLPLLRKSSVPRLVFVSSSLGSISQAADPNSKYYNPMANEYRASKAALNMLMVQYWAKLGKDGFKVFGADPGLVATNFVNPDQMRKRGAAEPHVGGERIAAVITGERDKDVGRVCGEYGVSPW
jgi:NAD(P)-dependent dehydrogenase (short-subunit alcohol dehydrogenase family)